MHSRRAAVDAHPAWAATRPERSGRWWSQPGSSCPSWASWVPSRRGCLSDLEDRYSASYAYPAFAVVVLLVFAVGWMVGRPGRQGAGTRVQEGRAGRPDPQRGRADRRGDRPAGRAARIARSCGSRSTPCRTSATGCILPLFLVVGYLFAFTAAKKHRGILRLVGVHQSPSRAPRPRRRRSRRSSTRARSSTAASPTSSAPASSRTSWSCPSSCCSELQHVADSGDSLKRARGRRGLEVVQGLRSEVTVTTPDVDFPDLDDVDAKLLKLAKERGLRILTTDFNLNRLARIQDVVVLNVNELANALKPAVLPGESVRRARDPRGQGARPGRRLPRRRHDGGGRGRPAAASATRPPCR